MLECKRQAISGLFQGIVGSVCEVTVRYWYKQKCVAKETLDPRIIYSAERYRVMHTVKREHGMGLKQIAPITMVEARNGTHHADHDSIHGVAACAAFCFCTLLGGRRPRVLTAIVLEKLQFTVGLVELKQTEVLVLVRKYVSATNPLTPQDLLSVCYDHYLTPRRCCCS